MNNGIVVDFVLGFNQKGIHNIGVWNTSFVAVNQTVGLLTRTINELDSIVIKSNIAFNGYTNSLNAYATFQQGIIKDKLLGSATDYMSAATMIQRKGVQMTEQNTKLLSDWAAASGETADVVANDLVSAINGSEGALEKYGISMQKIHQLLYTNVAGSRSMAHAVMDMAHGMHQFDDAFKKMPLTFDRLENRMEEMRKTFFQSIVGKTTDKDSLGYLVKNTIQDGINFIASHAQDFKNAALMITTYLRVFWRAASTFFGYVFKMLGQAVKWLFGIDDSVKKRMAGVTLYFGFLMHLWKLFYREHKFLIDAFVKVVGVLGAAFLLLEIPAAIINGLGKYTWQLGAVIKRLFGFRVAAKAAAVELKTFEVLDERGVLTGTIRQVNTLDTSIVAATKSSRLLKFGLGALAVAGLVIAFKMVENNPNQANSMLNNLKVILKNVFDILAQMISNFFNGICDVLYVTFLRLGSPIKNFSKTNEQINKATFGSYKNTEGKEITKTFSTSGFKDEKNGYTNNSFSGIANATASVLMRAAAGSALVKKDMGMPVDGSFRNLNNKKVDAGGYVGQYSQKQYNENKDSYRQKTDSLFLAARRVFNEAPVNGKDSNKETNSGSMHPSRDSTTTVNQTVNINTTKPLNEAEVAKHVGNETKKAVRKSNIGKSGN